MRDALLKGCTHSTEAMRPQPNGYTPINAQNIVRDFGVGGMGTACLGSAAWAHRESAATRAGVGGIGVDGVLRRSAAFCGVLRRHAGSATLKRLHEIWRDYRMPSPPICRGCQSPRIFQAQTVSQHPLVLLVWITLRPQRPETPRGPHTPVDAFAFARIPGSVGSTGCLWALGHCASRALGGAGCVEGV